MTEKGFREQEQAEPLWEGWFTRVCGSQTWHRERKTSWSGAGPGDFWEVESVGAGKSVRMAGSDGIRARPLWRASWAWPLAVPAAEASALRQVAGSDFFHASFCLRPSRWLRHGLPSREAWLPLGRQRPDWTGATGVPRARPGV